MTNTNVLILDNEACPAYLLRALLRGRGHGASISEDFEEARRKLETGLFDMLAVDLTEPTKEAQELIRFTNDLLPGLPVLVLSETPHRGHPEDLQVFATLRKPLKITIVCEAIQRGVNALERMTGRRLFQRKELDVPVEVCGTKPGSKKKETRIGCRVRNISLGGMQIEPERDAQEEFTSYFEEASDRELVAAITFSQGKTMTLSARMAYIEMTQRNHFRLVGLRFTGDTEGVCSEIEEIVFQES